MFSCADVIEFLGQQIHVLADFSVCDPGVDLCGADIRMTENLRHGFDGHVVGQQHRGCAAVPCHMEGQFLVYPAHGGNLLQIVIHPLVADYGQQFSIGELTLVLFQDGNRNIQQTDRCRYVGLVPFADDPEVAVEAGADVVGLQLADVNIGECREAAEDKQVADLFKPPGGDRWP